ncbi:GAF domain-containing protein [Microvirga sp. 2MCAF38]|uniref:GAF domain-containing protein n=1 Tax=Microvirga sp. 2MCAF38 TaxID=3232989 RepID=UPI003F947248
MTLRLADLRTCFEGVIPSIVATVDANGTPNISYLSHVVMVDDHHVALSNQFFSKTAANISVNPRAALLLVDGRYYEEFRLDVTFIEGISAGNLFEHVRSQLHATSAQVGMAGIMELRGLDVYRVDAIHKVPSPVELPLSSAVSKSSPLASAAILVDAIARQDEVDDIVDAVLNGLSKQFGYKHTLMLLHDASRGVLTTLGSRGYEWTGIGSEVPVGEGVIGGAVSDGRLIKVSDMSRVERFANAVRESSDDENVNRMIALPGMPDAMSQIGVPMIVQGTIHGVLFAESRERLAFTTEDEAALTIVARQAAASLVLADSFVAEAHAPEPPQLGAASTGRPFRVTYHDFDNSVFIDNDYIIKGVAGRLLMFMLDGYQREGRDEFTNREIRLSTALRLPDIKDNLETRLLLLRRRLEDKESPVKLVRAGRGRIRLQLYGTPLLDRVG